MNLICVNLAIYNEPVKVSDKNIFKSIKKIGYIKFEEIVPIFEVEHISKINQIGVKTI